MTEIKSNIEDPVILYEDSDLIMLNKPSGLLSVPDGYDPSLPHIKQVIEPSYGHVWLVHRLDKETSGLFLVARNAETHQIMNERFRLRKIEKVYHGLVTPAPAWREMDIQLPLQTNADRKHRTRVNEMSGKPAHSNCLVIKRYTMGVLMEIQIYTGISHQIRAHLRAYDLALLGDGLYSAGLTAQPFHVSRTMLHARTLGFVHPTSGQWLSVTAPYPQDFRDAYTQLRMTKAQDEMI